MTSDKGHVFVGPVCFSHRRPTAPRSSSSPAATS